MAIKRAQIDIKSKIKIHIYMATYLCQKTRESSIEAIQRTIAQSKFSLELSRDIAGALKNADNLQRLGIGQINHHTLPPAPAKTERVRPSSPHSS